MAALRLIVLVAVLSGTAGAASQIGTPAVVFSNPFICAGARLVNVDPATFAVIPGRHTPAANRGGEPLPSPDGQRLALGGFGALVLAKRDLAILGEVRGPPDSYVVPLAWQGSARLIDLAIVETPHHVYLTSIRVVDVTHRRVAARDRFADWQSSGWGIDRAGRVAVLLKPSGRLAAPHVVVAGTDGRLREVRLSRLRAGIGTRNAVDTRRGPSIAVDPGRSLAYVISSDEPTAIVDLRTLRVRYAPQPSLARVTSREAPPAGRTGTANPSTGWNLQAAWAGRDRVLIIGNRWFLGPDPTGSLGDRRAADPVQLLDLRDWSVRTIESRGWYSEQTGGMLIVHGERSTVGVGNGRVLYRLPHVPTESVSVVLGRLVTSRGSTSTIRDVRSGRPLARIPEERLERLAGGGRCS